MENENSNLDRNIFPSQSFVAQEMRQRRNGHTPAVLWLTGISGSGKSTLARRLETSLFEQRIQVYVLDGDNMRLGLNQDLGFSDRDRSENVRRLAEVAKLFMDAGFVLIVAAISPFIADRALARKIIGDNFFELFCHADLDVCEARDPKGLYRKVRNGEIKQFTNITSAYERPLHPDLVLDTGRNSPEICIEKIFMLLEEKEVFSPVR